MKAVALQKLDKVDEALLLAEEVRKTKPLEEGTLQTLTTFYRALGIRIFFFWKIKSKKKISKTSNQIKSTVDEPLVELFENVLENDPKNIEIYAHLHMACVRGRFFQKQQQVATKMYKTFNKKLHLFWAITSLFQQVWFFLSIFLSKEIKSINQSIKCRE